MIDSAAKERSDVAFLNSLRRLSDAGASLIQIRTREPLRAATIMRKEFTASLTPYHEWSASTGVRVFTTENYVNHSLKGDDTDFLSAFGRPLEGMREPTSEIRAKSDLVHYFAFIDPAPHLANNPFALDLVQQYAALLPTNNVAILFITDDRPLDMLPSGTVNVTELSTPTIEELEDSLTRLLDPVSETDSPHFTAGHTLDEEDIRRVAVLGLGLSFSEFETHVALSIIDAANAEEEALTVGHVLAGIAEGKTEVVRQSEILELIPAEDISNVGGMQRLKDWVSQRSNCYTQEARDFGVEPPKGLVLVGVPGAGKSLVAKAIASVLGVPLVRLDFGRVFSKYVGDSEQRVRSALAMAASMAPCVLFVDEIDKGLGGIGQGGDSGIGMRVLGTYLTWLQELKQPVFNMVTANRVAGLPPELLRRGRFDQIFSVSMPSEPERREVLEIHLRRRGQDIASFSKAEVSRFLAASAGYVPAEIESVVKDALVLAFSEGQSLTIEHLITAASELVPMSKSHAEQINAITAWAANNAVPVNYPDTPQAVAVGSGPAPTGRRIITPRTRK